MRVAFLLYQFPAVSETFILRQIVGLIDMGHDVHVYAERGSASELCQPEFSHHNLLERTTYLNLPSESCQYEFPVWPVWGAIWPPDSGERISNGGRLLRCIPGLVTCLASHPRLTLEVLNRRHYGYQADSFSAFHRLSALRSQRAKFDVLHAHFGPVGNNFRFARRLWNAPLVVSFHGYDFSTWPLTNGANSYFNLFREADMITVHSDYAETQLLKLGCPPGIMCHLKCGVDVDEFAFRTRQPAQGRPVQLLTVGRLVEKKGLEYSIRAVAQMLREGHHLRYEIIGDGPLRQSLSSLANDLGVANHIVFTGSKDNEYVRKRMNDSVLFILASVTAANGDTEGAPVSLLEAQASGLPVISTRHAGIPEIVIDEAAGLLVPEGDSAAIADALRRLLNSPSVWPVMGQRGRRFIEEHHDIRKLNRRLADIYQSAIRRFVTPKASPELCGSQAEVLTQGSHPFRF